MPKHSCAGVDDEFPQWFEVVVPDATNPGEVFM
jgi:hypothetical protein